MSKIIRLKTPTQKSTIYCGKGAFLHYAPQLAGKSLFIITDSNVFALYQKCIEQTFPHAPVYVFPAGERHKNKNTLFRILDAMVSNNLTRSSTVVAFGGGVVGDMAGLASALYMRGVHLVQIPTTLLAQVDSSVGGKTAVDYGKVKNAIGTFYQPEEVIIDPLFLQTLPPREVKCGLGEVIKYGVIDSKIYQKLTACPNLFDRDFLAEITYDCVKFKARIVQEDEHDTKGIRSCLNAGHTTGHAIELFYGKRSHGECVLIGLAYELYLSHRLGLVNGAYRQNLQALIQKVIGKVPALPQIEQSALLAVHDKKNLSATQISFIAPQNIGKYSNVTLPIGKYQRYLSDYANLLATGKEAFLKLAVIGKDVAQSQSPKIHSFIAKSWGKVVEYENVSIPPEQFEEKIQGVLNTYDGLNVTIPYKLAIMPHLSAISGEARQVGAVNTVNSAGMGFCTDGAGFLFMLQTEGINVQNKSVLMVGAGGAARAVVLELLNAGAFVEVYSRTYQKTADLCNSLHATYNRFHNQTAQGNSDVQNGKTCPSAIPLSAIPNKAYDIIINATGVGMHDSVGTSPVDEEVIARCHMAIDLIYRPAKSRFLELAERNGKPILNGLGMLFYQAYIAEQYFWNLPEQDLKIAKNLFEEYKKELQS